MTSVAATAADISVVIPTHNRLHLLRQTLASIDAQTSPPAEIIVVDDGSTDGTREMLEARGLTVVVNDDRNWGPARARNMGLERVSTEYVAFVDSDDLLLPRALESLGRTATAAPHAPFAYGCALAVLAADGGLTHEGVIATTRRELRDPLVSLFVRNSVPSSGAVVRTAAVRQIGGYDPHVEWSEDHHLWVRLAQQAAPAYFPDLVCIYRRHAGNRYTAEKGGVDLGPTLALAERDVRLREHVADRVGVVACETLADTLRRGAVREAIHATRCVVDHHGPKRRIAVRAFAHARARRASARLGDAVWRDRSDVRDWLANF